MQYVPYTDEGEAGAIQGCIKTSTEGLVDLEFPLPLEDDPNNFGDDRRVAGEYIQVSIMAQIKSLNSIRCI